MVLNQDIKNKILTNNTLSLKLALELGFTQVWIRESAHNNRENGPLTTTKAIQVIGKETGLRSDEILDDKAVEVTTDNES